MSAGDIRNEDYDNQRYTTSSNDRDESRDERTRSIRGIRRPFRGRFLENRGGFRGRGDRGSTRGSLRGDHCGLRFDQGSTSSNISREMNHGSSTRENRGTASIYRGSSRENQYNDSRDRDYRSERLQQEQQSNNRSRSSNEPRNDRNDHRSYIREGDLHSFRGPPDDHHQGNRDRFIRSNGDRNEDYVVRYSNEQRDSSHRTTTSRDEFREPSRRSIRGSRLFRGRGGRQPQRGGHNEQESRPRSYRSRSPIMDDRRER